MYRSRPRARRHGLVAAVFGLLIGALAALLGPAGIATAHAARLHTTPAAGAVVDPAPAEVVVRFTEHIRAVPDQVHVLGPAGQRADTGDPAADGQNLVIRLRTGLSNGTYLVTYRIVSLDGHPVAGGFSFSVGAPTLTAGRDGGADPGGGGDARVDPVVGVALPATRYLSLVGLILLAGAVLLLGTLWPAHLPRRGPGRLVIAGAVLLAAGTAGELVLQAPYATGGGLGSVSPTDLLDAARSLVGLALLVRLGVLALAVPLLAAAVRRRSRGAFRLLAVLGVVAAATWPFTGHSGSSAIPELTILTDTVHVAAMACWLGGLVMLLAFLLRRGRGEELAAILPVWSRWALTAVAALGTAGLVQGVVEVGTPDALVHTRYGLLLLAKVGVFGLILVAAAVARSTVHRLGRTGDAAGARPRLRRSVATELTLAAVVLALTAVLVQTVPARIAEAQAQPPFSVTLANKLYSLRIRIAPARVGDNTVDLDATTPDGRPLKVLEWFATATLPSRGIAPVTVPLRPIGDDRAQAAFAAPVAGTWRFRFSLRVSDIDQASVTGAVPVR